jgi:hypothetical protein
MVAICLLLAAGSVAAAQDGVQSMMEQESPEVFLAKATLQQYLSRVVRKDWDGARRLTHPKALAAIEKMKERRGVVIHNLAPWGDGEVQLKTFRFTGARQAAPGIVLVQVGEDTWRSEEQGMSVDDPAVYFLFRSRGGFLVGDKKENITLAEIDDASVRPGHPGYVDAQAQAQARRAEKSHR